MAGMSWLVRQTKAVSMNDAQKKSYDLTTDAAKQLLTLASAMLTLSATFVRDVHPGPASLGLIIAAYVALFTSIVFGLRELFLIVASIGPVDSTDDAAVPLISAIPGLNRAATAQFLFFGAGVALLAAFGFLQVI
jgi:hypothetical protein